MNDDELLPANNSVTPRRQGKGMSNSTNNEILKAYQVNAYKYVNKKYENRGKVGLALLGSKVHHNFNVLLYGKGNAHITQANVNGDFEITSTEELYVSFYDIKNENWSLRFESLDFFNDFLSRICIYKMVCSPKSDFVILDMKCGSGNKVQESDWCEIELNIHAIKNYDISINIYTSSNKDVLRTQIGSNKLLQAIEKGIVGMSKGGYRLIGIPYKSSFNKGGSFEIPGETNILAYVKLLRTKSKVERPTQKSDISDSEIPLPDLNFDKISESEYVDAFNKSKKSELIQKMEKIGKLIPDFNAEVNSNENHFKNYNFPSSSQATDLNTILPIISSPYNVLYDTNVAGRQLLPIQTLSQPSNSSISHVYPQIHTSVQPMSNDFNLLFTETRQNNTEMRVAISKLQDKIDKIHEKMDSKGTSTQQIVTRYMDAENVFENIKRIINENESLRLECTQKSDIIDKQNKRINEMLKNSQHYLEESHNVIQRNSVSFNSTATEHQNRILVLEEEKLNFIRNLSQKTSEVSQLELKLEQSTANAQSYRAKSLEYSDQINKLTEEIGDLKLKYQSLVAELNDAKEFRNSNIQQQTELESQQRQWIEEEKALKQKIEVLKANLCQSNSRINQIRLDCDTEINEIRQQSHAEIEEWKNKLKLERQRNTDKSSGLVAEIDEVNQSWEQKLEDFRQAESGKLKKLSEKNSQLMLNNANLTREILDLKEKLSAMGNIQSFETDLKVKNKKLSEQLYDLQKKHDENSNFEYEIMQLKEEILKCKEENQDYETLKKKNEELEKQVNLLRNQNNDLISMKDENSSHEIQPLHLEESIKRIMNDIFKKIKEEINLDFNYLGKDVVNICLIIIRDSTMQVIGKNNLKNNDNSSHETEEETSSSEEEMENHEMENNLDNIQLIDEVVTKHEQNYENVVELSSNQFNLKPLECNIDSNDHHRGMVETNSENINVNLENINENNESYSTEKEDIPPDNFQTEASIEFKSEILNMGNESMPIIMEFQDPNLLEESEMSTKHHESFIESHASKSVSQREKIIEIKDENEILKKDVLFSSEESKSVSQSEEIIEINDKNEIMKKDILFSSEESESVSQSEEIIEIKDKHEIFKKDVLFSSDEDDDVLNFFEKLNQRNKNEEIKIKEEKSRPVISDIDDDLSWLNN